MKPEQIAGIKDRLATANADGMARIRSETVHAWYSTDVAALLALNERHERSIARLGDMLKTACDELTKATIEVSKLKQSAARGGRSFKDDK